MTVLLLISLGNNFKYNLWESIPILWKAKAAMMIPSTIKGIDSYVVSVLCLKNSRLNLGNCLLKHDWEIDIFTENICGYFGLIELKIPRKTVSQNCEKFWQTPYWITLKEYHFCDVETRLTQCLGLNFDFSLPSLLISCSCVCVHPATPLK